MTMKSVDEDVKEKILGIGVGFSQTNVASEVFPSSSSSECKFLMFVFFFLFLFLFLFVESKVEEKNLPFAKLRIFLSK